MDPQKKAQGLILRVGQVKADPDRNRLIAKAEHAIESITDEYRRDESLHVLAQHVAASRPSIGLQRYRNRARIGVHEGQALLWVNAVERPQCPGDLVIDLIIGLMAGCRLSGGVPRVGLGAGRTCP